MQDIDLTKAYQALGVKKAKSLHGFHAFTGCDAISKFFLVKQRVEDVHGS